MNEEIFGGLRSATNRGETLEQAMLTFYNAGYKREEIEEAAKAFQMQRGMLQKAPIEETKELKKEITKPKVSKISSYESPKKRDKMKRILLMLILITSIIFIGALVFFFIM